MAGLIWDGDLPMKFEFTAGDMTTTAASVRAEALKEAATIAVRIILKGKQARRDSIAFDVDEAILALIDAPKEQK